MVGWLQAAVAVVASLFQTQAAPAAAESATYVVQPATGSSILVQGLEAARARDASLTRMHMASLADPIQRQILEWALIDTVGENLGFSELEGARARFAVWPREQSRIEAGEKALALSGADPDRVIAWFAGEPPLTVQGAMALAEALSARGRTAEAQTLVRQWWRERSFEAPQQETMLARYGAWLTQDDHIRRLDTLLYGPQGPATRAMLALVPPDYVALAEARMALRNGRADPYVPPALAGDPGLAVERARRARLDGGGGLGFQHLARFPPAPSHQDGQNLLWTERRNYFIDALRLRNWQAAYDAMAGHGFPSGERKVDAEFFAGWIALTKLNDPTRAATHFEALRQMSSTQITQGRALYWLGRAADARGDAAAAQAWYEQGARHFGAFYGQLAAERAGLRTLTLPPEPQPTAADRQRFEAYPLVQAARRLAEANETSLFRAFVMHLDDQLTIPEDFALLVDLARSQGMQDLSMHVARTAAQKGVILTERAYPVRAVPSVPGHPDPAFVHAIIRQESAFDPMARSHADARGMMQLLPSTARGVAQRLGERYDTGMLYDPEYNMRLGSYHLGELLGSNGGSYLLTAIAYNAGPVRARQWIPDCGDPRGAQTDPIDFIECAPFTETRNYMMRVMENMQVYRARLNGGRSEITLTQELARGVAY